MCDCKNTRVNYLFACPNVSITEVPEGTFLKNHTGFIEKKIVSCSFLFGLTDTVNTLTTTAGFFARQQTNFKLTHTSRLHFFVGVSNEKAPDVLNAHDTSPLPHEPKNLRKAITERLRDTPSLRIPF